MNPIHNTGYIQYRKFKFQGHIYECRETSYGRYASVRDAIDVWYRDDGDRIKLTRAEGYKRFKNVEAIE